MKRLLLTGNGNYNVAIPRGRRFSVACSGAFGGGTVTVQYNTGMTQTASSGVLTVSGVVLDGETVEIGGDVYEFAADVAQSVSGDNIAVDISADAVASAGSLTITAVPTVADTITIGSTVYEFVANGDTPVAGEIRVGADVAGARVNIVAAINGTAPNTPHPLVSAAAFAGDTCVITALIGGVAGDSIATTETLTEVADVFDAVVLGTTVAGVDCTAALAITALVAADAGTTYSLADGAGDTVDVTASTSGTAGNSIATDASGMANGSFAVATLVGGTDPIDRYVPFATTGLSLNAAGEKFGTNIGAQAEINLAVTSSTNPSIIAVVTLLED